ncbi:MAG: hypothetical protein JO258_16345 [Alphaproteobacteria bacterium]|nr:hypothetical protein [Alphaproteobacteria bacterium]
MVRKGAMTSLLARRAIKHSMAILPRCARIGGFAIFAAPLRTLRQRVVCSVALVSMVKIKP